MSSAYYHHPSSFRDPSGFVFEKDAVLYRQVNRVFKEDFDLFINSGCYDHLVQKKLLIPHSTIQENLTGSPDYYQTLKPEPIVFISYPYEWSFDMLRDAALLTLQLARESIAYGLIVKDATPYNVQWHQGKMMFIDTLSFEKYNEQEPWIAYRQFCENFLSPLLLMHYSKNALQQLLLSYSEGIPLAVTKSLLPWHSKFSLNTWLHIHLHAAISQKKAGASEKKMSFSRQKLLNLLSSLETLILKLKLSGQPSTWSAYYDEAAKRNDYLEQKKALIQQWITGLAGINTALDAGANDGEFSKLLAGSGIYTIAADFDPVCINNLYRATREANDKNLQPVIVDLSLPSPAIGVNNAERMSFISRVKVDLVMALAVIHHLSIGKNIPFEKTARLFSQMGNWLIIEFVPKADEKIHLMLHHKKDIYTDYTEKNFEAAFSNHFTIQARQQIGSSGRTLYLMRKIK